MAPLTGLIDKLARLKSIAASLLLMLKVVGGYLLPGPIFYLFARLDIERAMTSRAELHVISLVDERLYFAGWALPFLIEPLLLLNHRSSPY
jgi:hypothetical protein